MTPLARLARTAVLATSLLSLSGCAYFRESNNQPLDPAAVAQIQPGVSDAGDVVRILGAPNQVVQLGNRSAYRYDHAVLKGSALFLVLVGLRGTDTRTDRVWVFFDESDSVTHVGSTFESHRAQYALPWSDVHDPEDAQEADEERGLVTEGQ